MPEKNKISIVYVNYKSVKLLIDSIRSVIKSKPRVSFEIVVVDNEKNVKNEREIKKLSKDIVYLQSPKNVGYGAGINIAAKQAKGKYLLILNPDTIVEKGAIDKLTRFLEKKTSAGIVAPLLTDMKGKVYPQGATELTPFKALFALSFINKVFPGNKISREYFLSDWNRKSTKKVDVVPGTAFMIAKSLFDKVGGFDEKFFLYFEEFDLCKRVKELGKELYIYPGAKIRHYWGASTKKGKSGTIDKYFSESRFYYFKKHFGLFSAVITEVILRINFQTLLLLITFSYSAFLLFYKIEDSMPFGGERGQNYLQLKNYIENGEFPLVGPPTGRSWISLGPIFYWIMIPLFLLFNFDPIIPTYFFAFLLLLVAGVNYKLVGLWFGKTVAFFSTILILISPGWLMWARSARFYFLAVIFSYFYYYFLFSGLKGKGKHLYYAAFLIAIMLNFHLSVMIMIPIFIILLIIRRKRLKINYWKLFLFFSIPNIPLFIVSARERFEPIAKTVIWVPYRIAGFFGVIPKNNVDKNVLLTNIKSLLLMFGEHFYERRSTAALIMGLIFVIFAVKLSIGELRKKKLDKLSVFLITFWLYYLALFIHGSPPFHYYAPILLIFPLLIGLFFEKYLYNEKRKSVIFSLFVFLLILINGKYFFAGNWFKDKFERTPNSVNYNIQKSISKSIINEVKNEKYSIKRVGAFDYYEGYFAQNYRYLLWWMGNEPKENSDILYTIYEDTSKYEESETAEVVFDKYDVIVTKEKL